MEEARTGTYDANSNPRHLGPAPEEEAVQQEVLEAEREHLQGQLDQLGKLLGVFSSKGWKIVRVYLEGQLDKATQALIGDNITSMEGVAHLRGQMRAYEDLITFDEQTKEHHKAITKRIAELKQAGA